MEDFFNEIEAFLNNEMTLKESEAFKKKVELNKDLKRAFLYHKLANKAIQYTAEERHRAELQKIREKNGPLKTPVHNSYRFYSYNWLSVAASILIGVLGITLIYAQLHFSNKALVNKYFDVHTGAYIRSKDNQKNEAIMQEALAAFFIDRDYKKAMGFMEQIPESDINYSFAQYYVANCLFKLGKYEGSLRIFNQIIESETIPEFVEPIEMEWSFLLSNLATGNISTFEASLDSIIAREKIPDYYREQSVLLKNDANHFMRYFIFF